MKTSIAGMMEIAAHEGIVQMPYRDSVGVWTWGIGHTAAAGAPDPSRMAKGRASPLEEVLDIFRKDLEKYEAGVSAADFAQGMAQQVQMQIAMMTGDTALAEQLGNTVSTYLADPQSLLISAQPTNPVPIAQLIGAAMAAPQQIPQLLNLTISANP